MHNRLKPLPLGGGKVCGFFSLKEHQTNEKYKELIDKADYKYFCVIGNAIILYFHHKQLKAAVPYDILSSIELGQYDPMATRIDGY